MIFGLWYWIAAGVILLVLSALIFIEKELPSNNKMELTWGAVILLVIGAFIPIFNWLIVAAGSVVTFIFILDTFGDKPLFPGD